MNDVEKSWLAGIFEGDGCIDPDRGKPRLALEMKDKACIEEAARIWNLPFKLFDSPSRHRPNTELTWRIRKRIVRDPSYIKEIAPYFFSKRRDDVERKCGWTVLPEKIPHELSYIAGLLEAEGCLKPRSTRGNPVYPRIAIGMNDRDVIEWYKDAIGYGNVCTANKDATPHYIHTLNGGMAMDWMETLLPYMHGEKIADIEHTFRSNGRSMP